MNSQHQFNKLKIAEFSSSKPAINYLTEQDGSAKPLLHIGLALECHLTAVLRPHLR